MVKLFYFSIYGIDFYSKICLVKHSSLPDCRSSTTAHLSPSPVLLLASVVTSCRPLAGVRHHCPPVTSPPFATRDGRRPLAVVAVYRPAVHHHVGGRNFVSLSNAYFCLETHLQIEIKKIYFSSRNQFLIRIVIIRVLSICLIFKNCNYICEI